MTDPQYRQIADETCRGIESGRPGPGQRSTSKFQLRGGFLPSGHMFGDAGEAFIARGIRQLPDPAISVLSLPGGGRGGDEGPSP